MDHILPQPYYNPGDSVSDVEARFPLPYDELLSYYEVPGTQGPDRLPVIRNGLCRKGLVVSYHPEICSVHSLFQKAFERTPDGPLFYHRESQKERYKSISYREMDRMSKDIGLALSSCTGDAIVTIYMPNVWQFLAVDLACQAFSIANSCLYDLLGSELFPHIFLLTKLPIVFTHKHKIPVLLAANLESLKYIVVCEKLSFAEDAELFEQTQNNRVALLDWELFIALGKKYPRPLRPPTLDSVFTISFTSGTTSLPKGVVLSHRSMLSAITVAMLAITFHQNDNNKAYVFLPLAHCYLRLAVFLNILHGFPLYFPTYPTDVGSFFADFKDADPVILCLVPRILTKMELGLREAVSKSLLISGLISSRVAALKKGTCPRSFILDYVVQRKLKSALGLSSLEKIVCGSAPSAPETILFLSACLGVTFFGGYGLTETLAVGSIGLPYSQDAGTDGFPATSLEYVVKDVPEMGYIWHKNRSGELLIRGAGMCSGYMGDEDKYAETCEDGWFCTGDVVRVDERGLMKVVDRIKNFFKLSQGKFVASEKVQNVYLGRNEVLEQIFVYGDSSKEYLVGIVGVNVVGVGNLLNKLRVKFVYDGKEFGPLDYKEFGSQVMSGKVDPELVRRFVHLLNEPQVNQKLLNHINSQVKGKLTSYEMIKKAHFEVNPFTMADGTIGPTLKLKREAARDKWSSVLRDLYGGTKL